jgi:signal transduction histidine kinase
LRGPLGPETGTVRTRLLAVVDEVSPLIGFEPQVRFVGPIDSVVPEPVVDDLVAVLREALTNAARHASASRVDVDVSATTTHLAMEITDDGVGINNSDRRSGLANLEQRADQHGGSFVLGSAGDLTQPEVGGTRLRWSIPLS